MGGLRRRLMLHSAGLPKIYQEVEYLESTGTQYIDTGVYANSTFGFELDIEALSTSTSAGAATSMNWNGSGVFVSSGNGKAKFKINGTDYISTLPTLGRYVWKKQGNVFSIDDTSYSTTVSYNGINYNFYLFCVNVVNSASDFNKCRFYSAKISQDSTLVRNFIPCYRKADGVAGMYDTVGRQFYTNAGTGTFLVGADVGDNITRYGLVAEYLLQNNGNDTSGHGYDLTNQGGVTFDGNAAYFNANGTTSYFTINQTVIPTASSDVTISANVKCGSDASGSDYRNCIFQVHDSTYQSLQSGYELGIKYGNARGYVQGSTTKGFEIASSKAVADDNWHNLVLTANATSKVVNLYVDGLLVGTTTASTFPSQNSKPLRIGNQWSGSSIRFWLGYMKNIRIYNRVLPDAELIKLANEIAGYGGLPSGYRQITAIRGTGSQYLKTGVDVSGNFEMHFTAKISGTSTGALAGAQGGGGTLFFYGSPSSGMYLYAKGGNTASVSFSRNTVYDFSASKDSNGLATLTIGNTSKSASGTPIESSVEVYVFCNNYENTKDYTPLQADIYASYATRNGAKVWDYIPCVRESDNEVGMFDLISRTFIPSAEGHFVAVE